MYKEWAIKLALAPRPLMIYCASPLTAAMIITVAALPIVLAHGSKPTQLVSSLLPSPQYKRHICYSTTAWSWTVDYSGLTHGESVSPKFSAFCCKSLAQEYSILLYSNNNSIQFNSLLFMC
jgi:hypothetical protein